MATCRVAGLSIKVGNDGGVAEWLRQGPAKPCTRVRFPHPPRAIGAVGARFLDTEEVTGSNPVSPTIDEWPLTSGNTDQGLFSYSPMKVKSDLFRGFE